MAPSTDIVNPDELPKTWGLLVAKGNCLKVAKQAPALTPIPPPLGFMVMIMRAWAKYEAPAEQVEQRIRDGWKKGWDEAKANSKSEESYELKRFREADDRNREHIRRLETAHTEASRLGLDYYRTPEATRALIESLDRFSRDQGHLNEGIKRAIGAGEALAAAAKSAAAAVEAINKAKISEKPENLGNTRGNDEV